MIIVLFVFLFKQKTAYEMRISDWSSDVCSSDLLPVFFGIGISVVVACILVYGISSRGLRFGDRIPDEAGSNVPASTFADQMKREIGRASCRERVCQYV